MIVNEISLVIQNMLHSLCFVRSYIKFTHSLHYVRFFVI